MEKIKIGDVCDILNGFAFKSDQYVEDGIRIIRIANVQKGYIEDNVPVFYPINSVGLKYMLEEGDLLMSLTGNVGRVAVLQKKLLPAALNQRVACLRIKTNRITKSFLFHILNSDFFEQQCIRASKGVAQKNISTEWIKEYEIPMCSNEEQLKISMVLDKIRNIIELRKNELHVLDNLVRARFIELFGAPDLNDKNWDVYKMEQLCEIGSSKRIYQNEQSTVGIPFLRISDLVNRMDTGSKDCVLYISKKRFAELKEQGLVPVSGDILITARGTLGRCYIVQKDDEFYFQDGMITWLSKYNAKIRPLYISYLFEMSGFRKQIDSLQAGSTVAYLSISMTKKLDVMVPPIELQNQFANFVASVDKSKVILPKSSSNVII